MKIAVNVEDTQLTEMARCEMLCRTVVKVTISLQVS
jgi:hypothetical protein